MSWIRLRWPQWAFGLISTVLLELLEWASLLFISAWHKLVHGMNNTGLILTWLIIHKWVEIGTDDSLFNGDFTQSSGRMGLDVCRLLSVLSSFVWINPWPTAAASLTERPLFFFFIQSFCVLLTPVSSVSSPITSLLSFLSGTQPPMMTQGEQRRGAREIEREREIQRHSNNTDSRVEDCK